MTWAEKLESSGCAMTITFQESLFIQSAPILARPKAALRQDFVGLTSVAAMLRRHLLKAPIEPIRGKQLAATGECADLARFPNAPVRTRDHHGLSQWRTGSERR